MSLEHEIARRRTIAIISHPDAGKTTLTEKLLLYGGALQLAGSVTARKNQRSTTSDWMELEKQRGISVTSTVLQFDYRNCCINLLDTPGHRDFSEDTYRVLMAVDAVVMVIDAAKGIESQTLKLFEICRMRGIPIFTFMNKLDRPSRNALSLMDELEQTLQLRVCAMNWPLGNGPGFQGVYDRKTCQAHFFERTAHGAYRAPVALHSVTDPQVRDRLPADVYQELINELEMLETAGEEFHLDEVQSGDLSPVFFGSAINNFGVQLMLDAIVDYAPVPQPRFSGTEQIAPNHPQFSGFIFKIQSNMDPKHRDQIAFLRICSGCFTRDMRVTHSRTGELVRLSSSHRVFAKERETVDTAYAGDVIGLVGHAEFGIGDTLAEGPSIVYDEMPQFAPECFAMLYNPVSSQYKRFQAGLEHLLQEGALQVFRGPEQQQSTPLLGAVGALQFEVFKYRLETEYGASARLEPAPYRLIRWVDESAGGDSVVTESMLPPSCRLVFDAHHRKVVLFDSEWIVKYFCERNPAVRLLTLPDRIKRQGGAEARRTQPGKKPEHVKK
jgi:peptide chain release factor 3